jgi:hypothetical protein
MPLTRYENFKLDTLMKRVVMAHEEAREYDERTAILHKQVKEMLVELRSRGVGIRTLAKLLDLHISRIAQLTKGDDRVYGPEYVAELQRRSEVRGPELGHPDTERDAAAVQPGVGSPAHGEEREHDDPEQPG